MTMYLGGGGGLGLHARAPQRPHRILAAYYLDNRIAVLRKPAAALQLQGYQSEPKRRYAIIAIGNLQT